MIYLGIDPGKAGGLAVLYETGDLRAAPTPADEESVWFWLQAHVPCANLCQAVIERVHSFPGNGSVSMFAFGRSYGFLRGLLVAAGIPFEEVQPEVWQKALRILPRKKSRPAGPKGPLARGGKVRVGVTEAALAGETKRAFKQRLVEFARGLYPLSSHEITRATADAVLLATYCRLKCKEEV